MASDRKRRVLLIGWDAADWRIIHPLLDSGQMPNLARLIERGVMGNLASLIPTLSPMLWTSIATGKRPHKHGILGFVEPDPQRGAIRPVTSTSRRVKALWNILTQAGKRSNVVGWYASHPAEPIAGVCVSSQFPHGDAPGTIHPPHLHPTLSQFRMAPAEFPFEGILEFVPGAHEVDMATDGRVDLLVKELTQCISIHSAATWLMENEPWDFMGVYYEAIDSLCHTFMQYYPPRMEGVPERDFEIYRNVMPAVYRFHDQMLGRLVELAGEDTATILCSDHGYHSGPQRPPWTPRIHGGAAVCHRHFGILAMASPETLRDERVYGATILDITPTVLSLFGLPVGADMDGRVLSEAFSPTLGVRTIPSWEDIPGECGMHPPEKREDPWEANAVLRQLEALGYVEPSEPAVCDWVELTDRENRLNLARSLVDARLHVQALPILKELYQQHPEHLIVALALATCYQQTGQLGESRLIAEAVIARSQDDRLPAFGRPQEPPPGPGARKVRGSSLRLNS